MKKDNSTKSHLLPNLIRNGVIKQIVLLVMIGLALIVSIIVFGLAHVILYEFLHVEFFNTLFSPWIVLVPLLIILFYFIHLFTTKISSLAHLRYRFRYILLSMLLFIGIGNYFIGFITEIGSNIIESYLEEGGILLANLLFLVIASCLVYAIIEFVLGQILKNRIK